MRMPVKNLIQHAFSHGIGKLLEFCKSYDPGGCYCFMTNSFVFGSHSSQCQGRVTKISLGHIVAASKYPIIQILIYQKIYQQTSFHSINFPFFTNLLINWWKLRRWNHWLGFWLGSWSNRWREWHPGQRTGISRRECLWIQLKNHLI